MIFSLKSKCPSRIDGPILQEKEEDNIPPKEDWKGGLVLQRKVGGRQSE